MPKKEKKPIDIKNYLKQMEKAYGRREKVKEVLDDEEMLKKYLIGLGMNPEWTELPAVMEIIKNRFSRALKRKQKNFRVRESEFVLGRNERLERSEAKPNKITQNEFELGDEESLKFDSETGMIIYIKTDGRANFEKREIDSTSGVVVHHIKRFGGNAIDESQDDYYSLIEYTRDPKEPKVYYRTVYKSSESETRESQITEYDYGYPLELEKNGATHKKTPIYFIKRYPRYEQWFNGRFKSKDEYISQVFSMQKGYMNRLWKEYRKSIEENIIRYAKTKDKLDAYYQGLQEIFATNIIGPVFHLFINSQIKSMIENDDFQMFYDEQSKEAMLQEIETRLGQEVEKKPFEEVIRAEGAKVVARIGENPDYQTIKETFSGEAKSIEEEDYSMEEALVDIHQQSNLVEDFVATENPFQTERSRLESKIMYMDMQMRILQAAYKAFPRRRKDLRQAIEEIDEKQVKKKILPTAPPNPNGDER